MVTTLKVGTVNPTDTLGKFIDGADKGPNIWADYRIVGHYEKDNRIFMAGITSPQGFNGNAAAFFQLASPTLLWIVDWTVTRIGQQPQIPDPGLTGTSASQSSNWILLDEIYEPVNTSVGADAANYAWTIAGTYIYGSLNPSTTTTNDVVWPRVPYISDDVARTLPDSLLTGNLITSTASTMRVK